MIIIKLSNNSIQKNVLYVVFLLFLIPSFNSQEVIHNIKSDGQFEHNVSVFGKVIKGTYNGEYYKEKIEGKKSKIPHGTGVLLFESSIGGINRLGNSWSEGLIHGDVVLETNDWKFTGKFNNGTPESGVITYYYSKDSLEIFNNLQLTRLPLSFKGDFNNSKFSNGDIVFFNKDKYSGWFLNGIIDSVGSYEFHDTKKVYDGVFKKGRINGNGNFRINNDLFIGHFIDTICIGKCIIRFENGDLYEGAINNFTPHGNGVFESRSDLYTYSGLFSNGKYNGKGEIDYGNLKVTGEFKDGFILGDATIQYQDGGKYFGQIKNNNLPQGKGIMHFKNQDILEGIFNNGYFTKGTGTLNLSGTTWKGSFLFDNKLQKIVTTESGEIFYSDNKNKFIGPWSHLNIHSVKNTNDTAIFNTNGGKIYFQDNSTYTGFFNLKTGQPYGRGKLIDSENIEIEEEFREGVIENDDMSDSYLEVLNGGGPNGDPDAYTGKPIETNSNAQNYGRPIINESGVIVYADDEDDDIYRMQLREQDKPSVNGQANMSGFWLTKGNKLCGKIHVNSKYTKHLIYSECVSFFPAEYFSFGLGDSNGKLTSSKIGAPIFLEVSNRLILYRKQNKINPCPLCEPISKKEYDMQLDSKLQNGYQNWIECLSKPYTYDPLRLGW